MLGPSRAFTVRTPATVAPSRLAASGHTLAQLAASVSVRAPKASRSSPVVGLAPTAG